MKHKGPAYSLMRVLGNIDSLLDISEIKPKLKIDPEYEIPSEDQYIDILEHYEMFYGFSFPKEMVVADTSTIKDIVAGIKKTLRKTNRDKKYKDETIIEYIDCVLSNSPPKKQLKTEKVVYDKEQLRAILDYYKEKYKISISASKVSNKSIKRLATIIRDLRKTYHDPKYVLIYAKLIENKATREVQMDGPFFGPTADSKGEIDVEAKKLVDAQQNNAILPKIFERMGRSDTEIMTDAKKRFKQIFERIAEYE